MKMIDLTGTGDSQAPIAVAAALDIAKRAENQDGDFTFLVRGTIDGDKITALGWEWFWRPPSERTPSLGDIDLEARDETA